MVAGEIHPDPPPLVRHLVRAEHLVVTLGHGADEGGEGQVDHPGEGFPGEARRLGRVEVLDPGGRSVDALEEPQALGHVLADPLLHPAAAAAELAVRLVRHHDGHRRNSVLPYAVILEEAQVERGVPDPARCHPVGPDLVPAGARVDALPDACEQVGVGGVIRQIESRQAAPLEGARVPGRRRLDVEEVHHPVDQVAVIVEGHRTGFPRLQGAVQPEPDQAALLATEGEGGAAARPAGRVNLELLEQLEGDPGPDRRVGHDVHRRRRGEIELADAGRTQGGLDGVPLHLGLVHPFCAEARRTHHALAGELRDDLALPTPAPARYLAFELHRLELLGIEPVHQRPAGRADNMRVEEIAAPPVEQGGHEVGIGRVARLVHQVLERVLDAAPHVSGDLPRGEGAAGFQLRHGAVGEEEEDGADRGVDRAHLFDPLQPVLLDR